MSETISINEKERAALQMEWKGVGAEGVSPKDKKLLDQLASTFMLTNFGRPGVLFDRSRHILDFNKFSKVERNRANHLYLANIAISCLNNNLPLLQIKQLFSLIQDMDVTFRAGISPYTGKFEGFQKWNHSDFKNVRSSAKKYMKRLIDVPDEKLRAYKGFINANEEAIESAIGLMKRVIGIS